MKIYICSYNAKRESMKDYKYFLYQYSKFHLELKLRVLIKEILAVFHWLRFCIILLCFLASGHQALFLVQETTQELLYALIYALDKGKEFGTVFMDLSKPFDTLNHKLLLAKLKIISISWTRGHEKLILRK